MKKLNAYLCKAFIVALTIMTLSCEEDETTIPTRQVLNSFGMIVNGDIWEPSSATNEDCQRKISYHWGAVGIDNFAPVTFYKIESSRRQFITSEFGTLNTSFELNLTSIEQTGNYRINGDIDEHTSSFAVLNILDDQDNISKSYVNGQQDADFIVEITDLGVYEENYPGLAGFFSGRLYNREDPSDVLFIGNGKFNMRKPTRGSNDQCSN